MSLSTTILRPIDLSTRMKCCSVAIRPTDTPKLVENSANKMEGRFSPFRGVGDAALVQGGYNQKRSWSSAWYSNRAESKSNRAQLDQIVVVGMFGPIPCRNWDEQSWRRGDDHSGTWRHILETPCTGLHRILLQWPNNEPNLDHPFPSISPVPPPVPLPAMWLV